MGYTKEEVEKFDARDKRISKSGIIQALIQSGQFDRAAVVEADYLTAIAEKYLKWIWGNDEEKGNTQPQEVKTQASSSVGLFTWEGIASDYNVPAPTEGEKRILDKIIEEYMIKQQRAGTTGPINRGKLLQQIISRFRKYPTQERSVNIVVESVLLEDLLCKES